MSEYIPIVFLALFGVIFAGLVIFITQLIGPRKQDPVKEMTYESGIDPVGDARFRFNIKFYLIAMLFIIFDIEAVFLYPWAVVFRDLLSMGNFIMYEMAAFIGLLLIAYFYLLKRGAFDWE
ncbi:NADH-quinone oxidoreductase subunit A [candidate division KSB1 bacterium]